VVGDLRQTALVSIAVLFQFDEEFVVCVPAHTFSKRLKTGNISVLRMAVCLQNRRFVLNVGLVPGVQF